MAVKIRATVDDLYRIPENGKAEIIDGEMVRMSPTGALPGRAAMKITSHLNRYEEEHGGGYAFGDNVGFIVNLPNRTSFSPDAAWYVGSVTGMDFLNGAPRFAVEIRSKGDYGPQAERRLEQKRSDYFSAGTQVVWDVDLLSDDVIRVYRASNPKNSDVFRRGDIAEAEPAVPGWRISVDTLFK